MFVSINNFLTISEVRCRHFFNEILMSYHLYARKSWVRSEQVFRLLAKELYIVSVLPLCSRSAPSLNLKVWDFVCLRAFDLKPKGISRSKLFILFRMSGFFSRRPNRTLLCSLSICQQYYCCSALYAPADTDVSPFKIEIKKSRE